MSAQADTSRQVSALRSPTSPAEASLPLSEARPFYWSVRREIWENRLVTRGPLILAGLVLFATALKLMMDLEKKIQGLPALDPAAAHASVIGPFSLAPAPIMLSCLLAGLFYSLDALYGERRDRSILFWKSLPVSDRTTVLSKACIPIAVLPLFAFVLSVTVFFLLLGWGTLVLVVKGVSPAPLWAEVRFVQEPLIMLYGLVVHALWFAPVYAWVLLTSAWARRIPVLYAVLPPFAIVVLEGMIFNTKHFLDLLEYRVTGAMAEAFAKGPASENAQVFDTLSQLTPGRFLASPGLWLGLAFAVACLAAAIRLRRFREPI